MAITVKCPTCNGMRYVKMTVYTGKLLKQPCPTCKGTGKIVI